MNKCCYVRGKGLTRYAWLLRVVVFLRLFLQVFQFYKITSPYRFSPFLFKEPSSWPSESTARSKEIDLLLCTPCHISCGVLFTKKISRIKTLYRHWAVTWSTKPCKATVRCSNVSINSRNEHSFRIRTELRSNIQDLRGIVVGYYTTHYDNVYSIAHCEVMKWDNIL